MAILSLGLAWPAARADGQNRLDLRDHWFLQCSDKVGASPEVRASAAFVPDHWYATRMPATVLAAQVASGEFKDIFYADNLRRLPGMSAVPARDAGHGDAPASASGPAS